jgi:hypothetical protein
MPMTDIKDLSSLEKLLLGIDQPEPCQTFVLQRKGFVCPQCHEGVLDYNGLLQLQCPVCGFTEGGEGVGCT